MSKWLTTLWLALAGILVAVGLSQLGRSGRRQRTAETREQQYLADGSRDSIKKAAKENAKAKRFKAKAKDAAKVGQQALNRAGEKDESMDSMLDRYRKRLPNRPG